MQRIGVTYFKLLVTMLFWGGTFVAGKWAVREAPPFFVALLRFAIASAVLWVTTGRTRTLTAESRAGALVFVGVPPEDEPSDP